MVRLELAINLVIGVKFSFGALLISVELHLDLCLGKIVLEEVV